MKNVEDKLTLTFMALSDPTRRAILAKLASGEATVQELSKPFEISAPAVTKHLKSTGKGWINISRERSPMASLSY
jgi:DNA-binding transcriptional ArsR family regulator